MKTKAEMMSGAEDVEAIVEAVKPHFVGQPGDIVGAALADLLSLWLAGHVIPDDLQTSHRHQERLLKLHIKMVRALVPINYWLEIEPRMRAASEAGVSRAKLDS
jgi:hypothetical protein